MLETESSLLPKGRAGRTRVVAVCFDAESAVEIHSLLETLSAESVATVEVQLRRVSPATYVGKGKLEEVKGLVEHHAADVVVVDTELSPNQLRNVEKALGCRVMDRPGVILEIFSQNARTKEAKLQVELARLQYLLPRLAHLWSHFERQRGGGTTMRGMGESQIEVDRRLVKKRISVLQDRLKEISKERDLRRTGRAEVLKVALVGYTNAGKSTLLNAMTESHVLAENKLFATLDSSVRALSPDSHPPIVAIDTVGFISRIPTSLIASFRSTLEELQDADLLLHVVDASSKNARDQIRVTEEVLTELGLNEKPTLLVLNKVDLLPNESALNWARVAAPGAIRVSALDSQAVKRLRERVLEHFRSGMEVWEVVVPYRESRLVSQIYAYGTVEKKNELEKGLFFRVRMDGGWARKLGLAQFGTGQVE